MRPKVEFSRQFNVNKADGVIQKNVIGREVRTKQGASPFHLADTTFIINRCRVTADE